MNNKTSIRAPFFEIGPKSYLFGDDILKLAIIADKASEKYDVDIIFTCPLVELRRVVEQTKHLFVFAPHMDPLTPGRGLADVLPESISSVGAKGVMLNHCEKPLTLSVLKRTIQRAKEVELITIVCADSIAEAAAISCLAPDIIVAEPSELIGTGVVSDETYVKSTTETIKKINPNIMVLQGAGISNGQDVYNVIRAGAEATGSSSGIIKAKNMENMVDEMISSVRRAWDDRHKK